MKTWVADIVNNVDQTVMLAGWVANRRDHGKLIFIDLRDRSGVCQVVFGPWSGDEIYQQAQKLRNEWVIQVEGLIKKRPDNMINPDIVTGTVEVDPKSLVILSKAQTPPFPLDGDGYDIDEELRMKYKYLDLRRDRLQKNLMFRHKVIKFIRDYLDKEGFYEVETPILTKSTPEGARDYVVPSRLYPGTFYALPQAPQQYKQLLMAGGIEKYFQIARCFRDEDTRGDRQPEFTQMDLEMSFVEREDVMALNEKLLIALVQTLSPEKRIQQIPFPRLTYKEAIEKYGTDRPDLRDEKEDKNLLAFCWIIDFPFFEKNQEGGWTFTHNPFSLPKEECIQDLMEKKNVGDILTTQYDIVLNGFEIGGGSIRAHNPEILTKVLEIIGYEEKDILKNFGHMLEAFSYGAPPHGGIAWGLDRLLAIMQNEPNIREVIPFPKTGDARDLMMCAPAEVEKKHLDELGIEVKKQEKK